MARRNFVATLLVIVAVQFAAGMLFASVCYEPCPDDNDQRGCPPLCSFCTTCTHAQQAIVQTAGITAAAPLVTAPHVFTSHRPAAPSQLAADIFHVPLLG